MRITSVLSFRDLPNVELQAGVLDGELVRVGDAYCAIDTVVGAEERAASIAAEVPAWSIAERMTAAWVYGILDTQPRTLQLCVASRGNIRPISTQRCTFREVVIDDKEIRVVKGLPVTTPLRTALDIARTDDEFTEVTCDIVRGLSTLGAGFQFTDCEQAIDARRNLPNKRVALARLTVALGRDYSVSRQPALTR